MSVRARLLFVAALAGWALLLVVMMIARRRPRPVPPLPAALGELPAFRFVDARGQPFDLDRLRGHVTVVDFFFTRCASSCPRLTQRMAELQGRLQRRRSTAQLVSISVDPENDTPPVLLEYAARAGADPNRWSFVTGASAEIERVTVKGFRIALQRLGEGGSEYDVIHGDWFVLADADARLRGYYRVDSEADLDPLDRDMRSLEQGRPSL